MKHRHFTLPALSLSELDKLALEKAGLLGTVTLGEVRGTPPDLPEGWSCKWVAHQGVGNQGKLVLVGTTPRTKALLREGRVRQFMRLGPLSRAEAEALERADAPYKFELVGMLRDILDDPHKLEAILAHPGDYGHGTGRQKWVTRWGLPVFGESLLGISAPREAALARMVRAIKGG